MEALGSLVIAYQVPGQNPQSVVTINNQHLLRQAARVAMAEAEERAEILADADEVMARIQRAEVERLRVALGVLVPGFERPGADGVM